MNFDAPPKHTNRFPVFITARFRTGSTLLWNIFHQIPEVVAYYEPLHEKLPHWIASGVMPQSSHYHINTYFREYPPVKELSRQHSAEFGVWRLYLEAGDQFPRLKEYIQYLLDPVPADKTPVLQCNRLDFRLPWIKTNFPGAPIIHLYRSPRAQWFSSIVNYPKIAENHVDADPYLITTWSRDLCQQFPFLAGPFIRHAYQRHYYLWKLSYLAGSRLADVSISYEGLLTSPKETIRTLLQIADLDVQNNLARCLPVIIQLPPHSWKPDQHEEWFTPLEQECETMLTELGLEQDFGKKPLSEIIAEHPTYQKLLADQRVLDWARYNAQLTIVQLDIAEDAKKMFEEAMRSPILTWCFALLYWDLHHLRPYLKHLLPSHIKDRILRIRSTFHAKVGEYHQYPPIPLRIPRHYFRSTVLPEPPLSVVSIVTPSFNQGQFLERTITSVLEQNYPNLEYILQDGGSTDGTDQILEKYRSTLTYLESCKDTGQANAINRGFRHATGDIMAWLNADDLLLLGTIPYIVNFFRQHSEVDVVYGHRIVINERDEEIGRWVLPPHDKNILLWVDYIPQETLFWRRRIWEQAGGYLDESYHFAIDWELLLRFRDAGATFVRLPRFLGAFRVSSHQKTAREMEGIGSQEIRRLLTHCHGRDVSELEIFKHIRSYRFKQMVYNYLHRWGILRY